MCVTIRNSMHGVLLLPSLKKQRELIQGPITLNVNDRKISLRMSIIKCHSLRDHIGVCDCTMYSITLSHNGMILALSTIFHCENSLRIFPRLVRNFLQIDENNKRNKVPLLMLPPYVTHPPKFSVFPAPVNPQRSKRFNRTTPRCISCGVGVK